MNGPAHSPGNPLPATGEEISISVIVVNWNGRHLLKECLDSIRSAREAGLEILVVDNGSTDGSPDLIREEYGESVRLLQLASNCGWAGGNNRGIEIARGRYVLLLNNDACLEADFFSRLREGIRRNAGAGMYTPRILNYDDRSVLDNTGHVIYRDGTARGRGRLEKNAEKHDREEEVLCPSGAAGIYKKEIFGRIGPIDERYFAYGEDTELGLRARRAGYRCVYLPSAVVYHKYSATAGPYSPRKVYFVERNRIWTIIKLFPWYRILLSPFFTLARYAVGCVGWVSGKGAVGKLAKSFPAKELFSSVLKAYRDGIRGIPEMLRERRGLRKTFTVGDREFSRMLDRFSAEIREVSFNE